MKAKKVEPAVKESRTIKGVVIEKEEITPWRFFIGFLALYLLFNSIIHYIEGCLIYTVFAKQLTAFFENKIILARVFDTILLVGTPILSIWISLRIMFRYFCIEQSKIKNLFSYYFLMYFIIWITVIYSRIEQGRMQLSMDLIIEFAGIIIFPLVFALIIKKNNVKNRS